MTRFNKMRPAFTLVMVLEIIVVTFSASGCTGTPKTSPGDPPVAPRVVLTVSGSGSTTSVLEALKLPFERDNPGYRLEVLAGTGTNEGITGVERGVLDIVAMARPLKESEAAMNIRYAALGRAGVAIFCHPRVGITNLTTEQAIGILSGTVTNWAQVGGPEAEIILFVRDSGESSTQALNATIFRDRTLSPTAARVLTSLNAMLSAVEGTPASVGFGTWADALATQAKVQAVSLDNVLPTDPRYPVGVPLGIGYRATRQADVQPLLDWLVSSPGKQVLTAHGLVVPEP